jgi:hypothetical protein
MPTEDRNSDHNQWMPIGRGRSAGDKFAVPLIAASTTAHSVGDRVPSVNNGNEAEVRWAVLISGHGKTVISGRCGVR